jgi:hypothetical protein
VTQSAVPALIGLVLLTFAVARTDVRFHPAWKARTLALLAVAVMVASAVYALLTAATLVAQSVPPEFRRTGTLLSVLSAHSAVDPMLGVCVSAVFLYGLWRAVSHWRAGRMERRGMPRSGVVSSDRPFAVAVPEAGGRIVVSTALIRLLTKREVRAVYLHEQSHLDRHHHRYLLLTGALVAICPPLASVHRSMRFSVERWADEDAARRLDDRKLVARALAKVALATEGIGGGRLLGIADHQVARRIEALLHADREPKALRGSAFFGSTGFLAGGMAGAPLQLHHFLPLLLL